MSEQFVQMAMDEIFIDEEFNCRKKISPIDVVDLAKDILLNGLLQPVIIALQSDEQKAENGKEYRLIAGFRRYKAHMVNKAETILCSIHPNGVLTEVEARCLNLSENLNRADLNILQEAWALASLYSLGVTRAEAVKKLGKSDGWVQMRFMLLDLPLDVQKEVAAGLITQTQIRNLHKLYRKGTREELNDAVKKIKMAKERGEKTITVPPPKAHKGKIKHHMGRQEIFEMQEHIRESIGNNFGTRCLAWSAGEITNAELINNIRDEAYRMGKLYRKPDWA